MYSPSQSQSQSPPHSSSSPSERRNEGQRGSPDSFCPSQYDAFDNDLVIPASGTSSSNSLWGNSSSGQLGPNDDSQNLRIGSFSGSSLGSQDLHAYRDPRNSPYYASLPRMSQSSSSFENRQHPLLAHDVPILENRFVPSSNESVGHSPVSKKVRLG